MKKVRGTFRFQRARRRFLGWLGAVAVLPWLPGRRHSAALSLREAAFYRKHGE